VNEKNVIETDKLTRARKAQQVIVHVWLQTYFRGEF